MQLLQPKISFSIISLLSVILAGSTFFLGISTAATVVLVLVSLINLGGSLNSIQNLIKKDYEFNLRLGFLITFISAIIISFIPYLFDFTDKTNSFTTTSIFSFVFLVILFFTNTMNKEDK